MINENMTRDFVSSQNCDTTLYPVSTSVGGNVGCIMPSAAKEVVNRLLPRRHRRHSVSAIMR